MSEYSTKAAELQRQIERLEKQVVDLLRQEQEQKTRDLREKHCVKVVCLSCYGTGEVPTYDLGDGRGTYLRSGGLRSLRLM